MAELDGVQWPPEPLRTERLTLRLPQRGDRAALVDLGADPDVRRHLGGPRSRAELERELPVEPSGRAGAYAVDLCGALIGLVTVDRRDAERPGHVVPGGREPELSYLLLPHAWGRGYAGEACRAVLAWCDRELPGEPVVLATQVANAASLRLAGRLGFEEVGRFEEFGAEQWFGVRRPPGGRPGSVSGA